MKPHSEKCGCDDCERADAEERSAELLAHANQKAIDQWVAATLNKLQRFSFGDNSYSGAHRDKHGDYVRVDDVAEAFGLTIDAEFDETTGTYRGFKVKR